MSFKLYLLQMSGRIRPTQKIEAERRLLWENYQEFLKVEASEELKEFLELEAWVNSDEFKAKKKQIESEVFKGSQEFKQLQEFRKLSKAKQIKNYFAAKSSSELKRFEDFADAEKLAEYYKLKDYINDGQYRKEKDEINKQVFKGSVEEGHLSEFKKLQKSKSVRAYFELQGSPALKEHEGFASSEKLKRYLTLKNAPENGKAERKELKTLQKDTEIKKYFRLEKSQKLKYYHEINGSHTLKRYNELQVLTTTEEFIKRKAFLEDKKKYEKSDVHKKFLRYKQLASDGDVKFYLSYEKSKIYRNYLDVKDSFDLKRYYELKELTESKEFLNRKAYLEDNKKWEKTEEFKKQQKLLDMKKQPQFVLYFKYKGTNDFDFFRTWETVFEDDFESSKPDTGKWSTMGYWAQKLVGENFSQPGDLQCFSDGKNFVTGKNGLAIQVRKEKAKGKYWNPASGFVPEEFQYTSGQLCTGDYFLFEDGIIEAKIKFNPVDEIVSSFHLLGEKVSPQINVFEMGVKNRVGILESSNGKVSFNGTSISNLKKNTYYIFGLEKEGNRYTWKLNGRNLHEMPLSGTDIPMHLNLASIVVSEVPGSKLPANFEIGWIKCYRKKLAGREV